MNDVAGTAPGILEDEEGIPDGMLANRLRIASESFQPHVLRNTITALTLLGGAKAMDLFARLLRRLAPEHRDAAELNAARGQLMEHASRRVGDLGQNDAQALREALGRDVVGRRTWFILARGRDESRGLAYYNEGLLLAPKPQFLNTVMRSLGAAIIASLGVWFTLLAVTLYLRAEVDAWTVDALAAIAVMSFQAAAGATFGAMLSLGAIPQRRLLSRLLDSAISGIAVGALVTVLTFMVRASRGLRDMLGIDQGSGALLMAPLVLITVGILARLVSRAVYELATAQSGSSRSLGRLAIVSGSIVALFPTAFLVAVVFMAGESTDQATATWLLAVPTAFAASTASILVERSATRAVDIETGRFDNTLLNSSAAPLLMTLALIAAILFAPSIAIDRSSIPGSRWIRIQSNGSESFLVRRNAIVGARLSPPDDARGRIQLEIDRRAAAEVQDIDGSKVFASASRIVTVCTGDRAASGSCLSSLSWIPALFRAGRPHELQGGRVVEMRVSAPLTTIEVNNRSRWVNESAPANGAAFQFALNDPRMFLVTAPTASAGGIVQIEGRTPETKFQAISSDTGIEVPGGRLFSLPAGIYRVCFRTVSVQSCDLSMQAAYRGPFTMAIGALPQRNRSVSFAPGSSPEIFEVNQAVLLDARFTKPDGDISLRLQRFGPEGQWLPVAVADNDEGREERMLRILAPGRYRLCGEDYDSDACVMTAGTLTYSTTSVPQAFPTSPPPAPQA